MSNRRRMARPTVDLPQPDSPTRDRVSPRSTSKDTPSTACTQLDLRLNSPPRTGKCFLRSLTWSSGALRRRPPPGRPKGGGEGGGGHPLRPARRDLADEIGCQGAPPRKKAAVDPLLEAGPSPGNLDKAPRLTGNV